MRKNIVLALCALLAAAGVFAQEVPSAQEAPSAKEATVGNAVSIDPIAIIFNLYSGSYERALTDLVSVKASVSYSPNFFWISDISYFDFAGEGRFYFGSPVGGLLGDLPVGEAISDRLFAKAIVGPYVGAMVGFLSASVRDWIETEGVDYSYDADAFGIGGGACVGLKYVLFGKSISFFVEPFVGLRYYALVGGENGWRYSDADGATIPKPASFDDGFSRSGLYYGLNAGIAF